MNIDKGVKYIAIGGVFLIPFIPLIVLPMFFPFITGKNFAFRIIVEIIFAAWLILAIRNKTYRPKKSYLLSALTILIVILIASTIFGISPSNSFWSTFERMEGLLTHLHLFAYFLVITSLLNTKKLWKMFFHVSIGVSIIISIYSLLQLAGHLNIHQGQFRVDATFGNATYLAVYMLFHIFITLIYALPKMDKNFWWNIRNILKRRKRSIPTYVYISIILLQVVVLYYTATRGVIFGLIGGVVLSLIVYGLLSKGENKKIPIIVTIVIVLFFIVFASISKSNFIQNNHVLSRFANISLSDGTVQARFLVWKTSFEGFKERPILGWGPENYGLVFAKYYDSKLVFQEPWFDRAHNIVFDRLISSGILGLLSYLSLFFFSIYYIFKRKNNSFSNVEKCILTGLLGAYFFQNLFVFDNITSYILFVSILGFIHSGGSKGNYRVFKNKEIKDEYLNTIISIIIVLTVILSLYFLNIRPIQANHHLLQGIKPTSNIDDLQNNINSFEWLIEYNGLGSIEAAEHVVFISSKIISAENIDNDIKQKFVDATISLMKKGIDKYPTNVRLKYFYGIFLGGINRIDDSIQILNDALKIFPNKQSILLDLGRIYIMNGNIEKAILVIKKAYELEPSYRQAALNYAVLLLNMKNIDEAEEILIETYGSLNNISDIRFVNPYTVLGETDIVVSILENIVLLEPNNLQYRLSLAFSYFENNEIEKAVEIIEKIIIENPDFSEQGTHLINEIKSGRNPKNY